MVVCLFRLKVNVGHGPISSKEKSTDQTIVHRMVLEKLQIDTVCIVCAYGLKLAMHHAELQDHCLEMDIAGK